MAQNKAQHFVPQCYLTSWTSQGELCTLSSKGKGIVRKQRTREICRQDHLYTLRETMSLWKAMAEAGSSEREASLFTETFLVGQIEGGWKLVLGALLNKEIITRHLWHSIKSFVAIQSMRTPRFIKDARRKKFFYIPSSSDVILDTQELTDAELFVVYLIHCRPQYGLHSTLEVLEAPLSLNFITSDNPASHWICNNNKYSSLPFLDFNYLWKNPYYKIICPLHPKFCAILTPNLGLNLSDDVRNSVARKEVFQREVKFINQLVASQADKMIFARAARDFI